MAIRRLMAAALLVAGGFPMAAFVGGVSTEDAIALAIGFGVGWLPVAAVTAELASTIPAVGGPYAWGRVAFGSGWGFIGAWWRLLTAVLDVALVGAALPWLCGSLGCGSGFPAHLLSPAGVVAIGALVTMWPSVIWPLSVLGVVSIAVAVAFAPSITATPLELAGPVGAGVFGAAFAVRGADLAGLVVGEVVEPRRAIPWAIAFGSGVVAILVLGPAALAGLGGHELVDSVLGPTRQLSFLALALVGLMARGAAGIAIASRLVGAVAIDRYLPKAFSLGVDGLPSRHAVVLVTVGASFATLIGEAAGIAALTAVWAGSVATLVGSLVVIRAGHSRLRRGFMIPGGIHAVGFCAALAVAGAVSSIAASLFFGGTWWVTVAGPFIASGPIAWVALTIAVKRGRPNHPLALEMAVRWFDMARPGTPEIAIQTSPQRPFTERIALLVPAAQFRVAPT